MMITHEMGFLPKPANMGSDELTAEGPSASLAIDSIPLVTKCTDNDDSETINDHASVTRGRVSLLQVVREQVELSAIALFLSAFRRTGPSTCKSGPEDIKMDVSWPRNVRHVTHVTFDRFNGFLGLPVEFEMEVPKRAPSASATVFGVSAESMQCSYDKQGNSVPTVLLSLQEELYKQDGLKAEGIFRINAENSQEEHVRDQLNKGVVPADVDVHCLASLIKAWFRELPKGVLDDLSPDQVMKCHTEGECLKLIGKLHPIARAVLNWVINLMVDVVQMEQYNKMNARNVAMVFAPNMTQMLDPLTALMHAVQVMNLLKTLILRTLKERDGSIEEIGIGGLSAVKQHNNTVGMSRQAGELMFAGAKEELVLSNGRASIDPHDVLSNEGSTDLGGTSMTGRSRERNSDEGNNPFASQVELFSMKEISDSEEDSTRDALLKLDVDAASRKPQCLANALAEKTKTMTIASALAEKKSTSKFSGLRERKSLVAWKKERGGMMAVTGLHRECEDSS